MKSHTLRLAAQVAALVVVLQVAAPSSQAATLIYTFNATINTLTNTNGSFGTATAGNTIMFILTSDPPAVGTVVGGVEYVFNDAAATLSVSTPGYADAGSGTNVPYAQNKQDLLYMRGITLDSGVTSNSMGAVYTNGTFFSMNADAQNLLDAATINAATSSGTNNGSALFGSGGDQMGLIFTSLTVTPEPSRALLALLGFGAVLLRRRR